LFLKTDGAGNLSFDSLSFSTPLAVIGNATAGSEIRLPEDTDNGSNYVAIKAPDTIASNLTLTLPSADGTSGQVLQTNGSGVLSFSSVSSDFVLLASTVTTSSASVSFDGYFSSTYDTYVVYITGYGCATDGSTPYVRFRRSNADVTASNYRWANSRNRRSSSLLSVEAGDGLWDSNYIGLMQDMSNDTIHRGNYVVTIFNPLSTDIYPSIIFDAHATNAGNGDYYRRFGFGRLASTGALSGISFLQSSGNIAGRFKLYGIKA